MTIFRFCSLGSVIRCGGGGIQDFPDGLIGIISSKVSNKGKVDFVDWETDKNALLGVCVGFQVNAFEEDSLKST